MNTPLPLPLALNNMASLFTDDVLQAARADANRLATTWSGFGSALETAEGVHEVRAHLAFSGAPGDAPDEIRTIPGPASPLELRIFRPSGAPRGIYLDLHGGGFVLGSAAMNDGRNRELAINAEVVVVSLEYRLAPEHPHPAAPDDCEAAARWILDQAVEELGTDRLVVGGASAGANLAVVTILRLRQTRRTLRHVHAVDLRYGPYDLTRVPTNAGDNGSSWRDHYLPAAIDRRAFDVSPMFAELNELPPALFTVGTLDDLYEDSLFLATRWAAAGSHAVVDVYSDFPHGFDSLDTPIANLARCRARDWIVDHLP